MQCSWSVKFLPSAEGRLGGVVHSMIEHMTKLINLESQTKLRQKLRKESSKVEQRLWFHLRNKQFHGLKFRRQYGIGNFVVDFCCPEQKLVLEIDGDSHFGDLVEAKDQARARYIESLGFRMIRFSNSYVMTNINGILEELGRAVGVT
jgi:very-short-patch-repair endonuclease